MQTRILSVYERNNDVDVHETLCRGVYEVQYIKDHKNCPGVRRSSGRVVHGTDCTGTESYVQIFCLSCGFRTEIKES